MDVHSYGMIGCEIITRKPVFSECSVSPEVIIDAMKSRGEKLNKSDIISVANSINKNSSDAEIFQELNAIVHQCWKTEPKTRPKVTDIVIQLSTLA